MWRDVIRLGRSRLKNESCAFPLLNERKRQTRMHKRPDAVWWEERTYTRRQGAGGTGDQGEGRHDQGSDTTDKTGGVLVRGWRRRSGKAKRQGRGNSSTKGLKEPEGHGLVKHARRRGGGEGEEKDGVS